MKRRSRFWRPEMSPWSMIIWVSIAIAAGYNSAFWQSVWNFSGGDSFFRWQITIGMALFLLSLLVIFFSLFSFRLSLKPLLIWVLLASALSDFFMRRYGIRIDESIVRNLLQADHLDVVETVSWDLVRHTLLLGVLPAALVLWVRIRWQPWLSQWPQRLMVLGSAVLLICMLAVTQHRELVGFISDHKFLRYQVNPPNHIDALLKYLSHRYKELREDRPFVIRDPNPIRVLHPRPVQVVLVIGESARGDRFALNGYARPTTPRLSARGDVLSFHPTTACGTSTFVAVPCLLSPDARAQFNRRQALHSDNLVSLLQRAGVTPFWVENDGGCGPNCQRMPSEQVIEIDEASHPQFCRGVDCDDRALLSALKPLLASRDDRLIVLHQRGSHGPAYHLRTPKPWATFQPVCREDRPSLCDRAGLDNAYDNTIVLTDWLLAESIAQLAAQPGIDTALVYIGDHGESLGEDGVYLHAYPYLLAPKEQLEVPFLLWLSPGMQQRLNVSLRCLGQQAGPFSHDQLFHTLISLFSVQSPLLQPSLSLLSACQSAGR